MPLELSASFGGLTLPARKEKTKFLHLNQEQISQNQMRWRLRSVSGEIISSLPISSATK
jgi:hypothetical protein